MSFLIDSSAALEMTERKGEGKGKKEKKNIESVGAGPERHRI